MDEYQVLRATSKLLKAQRPPPMEVGRSIVAPLAMRCYPHLGRVGVVVTPRLPEGGDTNFLPGYSAATGGRGAYKDTTGLKTPNTACPPVVVRQGLASHSPQSVAEDLCKPGKEVACRQSKNFLKITTGLQPGAPIRPGIILRAS